VDSYLKNPPGADAVSVNLAAESGGAVFVFPAVG